MEDIYEGDYVWLAPEKWTDSLHSKHGLSFRKQYKVDRIVMIGSLTFIHIVINERPKMTSGGWHLGRFTKVPTVGKRKRFGAWYNASV